MKSSGRFLVLLVIFLVVFIVYSISPVRTPADSRWSIHTALSLVREGNADLDEYQSQIVGQNYYGIDKINGHLYSWFPASVSILVVPVVFLVDQARGFLGISQERFLTGEKLSRLALVLASFIVASTAVFIYLISQLLLADELLGCLLTFIFAFATPAWSTASRALWQHGPSMLMLSVTLYLILLAEKKPGLIVWTGLPLAFSYIIRPTNSLSLLVLSVYVLIKHRDKFWRYLLGVGLILLPFFIFNYFTYHSLLPYYYQSQRIGISSRFLEALLGNLFSPARGLLIFCPVFFFSFWGVILKLREKQLNLLDIFLAAIIFLHWLVISSFPHWWGGHSFGPRFFSDMTPYFIYFLVPFLSSLSGLMKKKSYLVPVFLFLVIFSVFVNGRGATNWYTNWWNLTPRDVDNFPERVWDWKDLQFLRF